MSFSNCITVQLSNLVTVGRTLRFECRPSISKRDSGTCRTVSAINYTPVPSIEAKTADGSIAVTFPWRCKTSDSKSAVEHMCAFKYRFHELHPLAKVMGICTSLRDLVTICVHAPSAILDTKLTHPELKRPISLYTQWIGADISREQDLDPSIEICYLRLTTLVAWKVSAAWLDMENKYSELIALLVSHWYAPTLYRTTTVLQRRRCCGDCSSAFAGKSKTSICGKDCARPRTGN